MSIPVLLALGLLLNAAAAAAALWRGAVDSGGAAAGTVVGTLIFTCGGPLLWLVLATFFISSTAVGGVRRAEKEWLKTIHEKGDRRDMFQVLANGGMGMLTAVLYRMTGDPAWVAGLVVSFASSNADTWASELGVLSRGNPISLLTFRPMPRGVSGGVSLLGLAVASAGALLVALVFAAENLSLGLFPGGFARVVVFVTAGGFLGALVDSLLGATIQAQYEAKANGAAHGTGGPTFVTERSRAGDGSQNRLVRGLAFVNNDVVNGASCAAATLAAVLLSPLLS